MSQLDDLRNRRKALMETRRACNFRLVGVDKEIREVDAEIKKLKEGGEDVCTNQ